ncbi:MAG TPA: porin family protein [Flavobacteriaceae bacterium]|nr:porin family protein [Flavobacteriaceae bacterium]
MKKFIVAVFALCFAFSMQAQKLDLGVKVGANFSNLSDAGSLNFKNKTGLTAGAFLSVGSGKFAVQPELLYSQQGAKTDLGDFDLDYITVPVMFKFYLIENLLNIQAGPQFGFVTNSSLKDQIETKDFEFSGTVGAGLELPLGFRVDARYNHGFTDVVEDGSAKNGVFSLAVGYSFL